MNNINDNQLYTVAWICATVMVCFLVGAITFYNVVTPAGPAMTTGYDVKVKMVEEGYPPAVVRCIDADWSLVVEFEICKKVLTDNNLTRKDAEELVKQLE